MTTLTNDELQAIRARERAATQVPGWYWCMNSGGHVSILCVSTHVGGPRLFVCGQTNHIFPDERIDLQWAGPIPMPKEPPHDHI